MDLKRIYTISEAGEVWDVSLNTLKKLCSGQKGYPPRFTDKECRKSNSTWLITEEGMIRLFGDRKK